MMDEHKIQSYGKDPVPLSVSWIDPDTDIGRITIRGEYSVDFVGHRIGETDIVLTPRGNRAPHPRYVPPS